MVQVYRAGERDGEPLDLDRTTMAAPGLNSLLALRAEEAGDYIVRVTSFGDSRPAPTGSGSAEQ